MSMERDWVVVASSRAGEPYDLTHMNAVMRRIDLICKLIAPILISIIISATNTRIGVIVVGGMSASSWAVEMLSARHVWKKNPRLQELKILPGAERPASRASNLSMRSNSIWYTVKQGLSRYIQDFRNYFCSSVWIPSLSLSLLHLSALSYGATFITFLLSAGFSLDLITIARAVGSLVEISSTVVTPFGVNVLGRAKNHGRLGGLVIQRDEDRDALLDEAGQRPREEEGRTITGLERLGLWGLCWQLLNLVCSRPSCPLAYADLNTRFQFSSPSGPSHQIPTSTRHQSSRESYPLCPSATTKSLNHSSQQSSLPSSPALVAGSGSMT